MGWFWSTVFIVALLVLWFVIVTFTSHWLAWSLALLTFVVVTYMILRRRRRRLPAARAGESNVGNSQDLENPQETGTVIEPVRAAYEESSVREDVYLHDPSLAALQQRLKARKGENDPEMENMISEALFVASAPVPTNCDDMVCSICLEDIARDNLLFSSPNCNHTFHLQCIEQWIYKAASLRCPNCNQEFDKAPERNYASVSSNLVH